MWDKLDKPPLPTKRKGSASISSRTFATSWLKAQRWFQPMVPGDPGELSEPTECESVFLVRTEVPSKHTTTLTTNTAVGEKPEDTRRFSVSKLNV